MRGIITAAALLAATAGTAQAQDACSFRATPAVGSWAQYKTTRNGQDASMRLALVGQEKRDGKDALWFETVNESERGKMISELLVPSYPFEQGQVIEMIAKRGDQPAMKMSGSMMGMMRQGGQPGGQGRGGPGGPGGRGNPAMSWASECKSFTVVGSESVTVPAGNFTATHLRNPADSNDVWVSREVPFGVIKAASSRMTLELTGSGKDARKSITETPQEMSGM